MPGVVVLAAYDERWPARFAREKARLEAALAPYVLAIEHVGSTAVVGLAAKPTVDILVGIFRLSDAPRLVARMEKLGYAHVQKFEEEIPERRYFHYPAAGGEANLFHVHMVEVGSPFWERHLLFRDFLRSHAEAAREYEALKRRLAEVHGSDRDAYTAAKTEFISKVEGEARAERAKGRALKTAAGAAPPHPLSGGRPPPS